MRLRMRMRVRLRLRVRVSVREGPDGEEGAASGEVLVDGGERDVDLRG